MMPDASKHFVRGWKPATPAEEVFSYFKRMDDIEQQKPKWMRYSVGIDNNLDRSHFYKRRNDFYQSLRQRKGI